MKCCANCFSDRHLTKELFNDSTHKYELGKCNYCGSEDVNLRSPEDLRDYFELLIGSYTYDSEGKTLVEWFKNDWELFTRPKMDNSHAKDLLTEILDDGEIPRKKFKPKGRATSESLVLWEKFRSELMFQNRFFPKTSLDLKRLSELFSYLLLSEDELATQWFRARVNRDGIPHSVDKMGAPPHKLSSHGRANPAGIPYLYMASDLETAISEIRPHTGDNVTVATVHIGESLKIVDLRMPRYSISPFQMEDESQITSLREDIDFLVHLGNGLTQPVLPNYAAIDYTPSQYLCEYIKQCGFDGVMYRSSMRDGFNIALFDTGAPHFDSTTQHIVTSVSVQVESN